MTPQAAKAGPMGPFEAETSRRIARIKEELGDELVILGHHYMSDEAIAWADHTGDSLALSRLAAGTKARYIVFLGVHFMAETADIVAQPGQTVLSPDPAAGCLMAEMASIEQVEACWRSLGGDAGGLVPITYVNSSAKLKAFCGRHGGAVCTSSNAAKVLGWALEGGRRALFFPDQHLARNTALALGVEPRRIALWLRDEGRADMDPAQARVIAWDGYCPVHVRFTAADIARARREHPGVKVIVHPECPQAVVAPSDDSGSTERIIDAVGAAGPGSAWAVGTELNLVGRLAARFPDKEVFSLNRDVPVCPDMAKISSVKLLAVLQGLVEGKPRGVVSVPEDTARWANKALEAMFAVS